MRKRTIASLRDENFTEGYCREAISWYPLNISTKQAIYSVHSNVNSYVLHDMFVYSYIYV